MSATSTIEWTEATWNPVTGCSYVSDGCKNCYARRMANRLRAMLSPRYRNGFAVTLQECALWLPLTWREPRMIFVNSMGDLFHEEVPFDYVIKVFTTMRFARAHRFQVLTKRAERLAQLSPSLVWSTNVWQGVTVESGEYIDRINILRRRCGAMTKFLSLEPLLSAMPRLDLRGIDWVIVGGESGPGARPICADWVRDIRDQCLAAGVPFFLKGWGGLHKKRSGRILDGREWLEMPRDR